MSINYIDIVTHGKVCDQHISCTPQNCDKVKFIPVVLEIVLQRLKNASWVNLEIMVSQFFLYKFITPKLHCNQYSIDK